jgi:hypothetical protein
MALNRYTVGALIQVQGQYQDAAGNLVDPTDARVDVLDPTGTTTTYAYSGGSGDVQRASTGVYTYAYSATLGGRVQWRFWSPPGAGQTADKGQFLIMPFPQPIGS